MFGKAFQATFGVGCALVIGLIALVAIGGALSSTPRTTTATTPPLAAATSTIPPPAAAKTWTVVKAWSGDGIKDTEDFTVGSEWRIDWDYQPTSSGIIQIYVHEASTKRLVGIAANSQRPGADTSFQRGAGTYYLTINAISGWKVAVQDAR